MSGCIAMDSNAKPRAITGKKMATLVIHCGTARSSQIMATK
jgi:hypothetical protein